MYVHTHGFMINIHLAYVCGIFTMISNAACEPSSLFRIVLSAVSIYLVRRIFKLILLHSHDSYL